MTKTEFAGKLRVGVCRQTLSLLARGPAREERGSPTCARPLPGPDFCPNLARAPPPPFIFFRRLLKLELVRACSCCSCAHRGRGGFFRSRLAQPRDFAFFRKNAFSREKRRHHSEKNIKIPVLGTAISFVNFVSPHPLESIWPTSRFRAKFTRLLARHCCFAKMIQGGPGGRAVSQNLWRYPVGDFDFFFAMVPSFLVAETRFSKKREVLWPSRSGTKNSAAPALSRRKMF